MGITQISAHHGAITQHHQFVSNFRSIRDVNLCEQFLNSVFEPAAMRIDNLANGVLGIGVFRCRIDERASPKSGLATLCTNGFGDDAKYARWGIASPLACRDDRSTFPLGASLEVGHD